MDWMAVVLEYSRESCGDFGVLLRISFSYFLDGMPFPHCEAVKPTCRVTTLASALAQTKKGTFYHDHRPDQSFKYFVPLCFIW